MKAEPLSSSSPSPPNTKPLSHSPRNDTAATDEVGSPGKPELIESESQTQNAYTPAQEKSLILKQDLTILPLSAFIYLLCYLDRSNIGNARILNSSTGDDMQTEIGATQREFNIALMVFLVGYAVFEVPSNVLLKKLRPSRW